MTAEHTDGRAPAAVRLVTDPAELRRSAGTWDALPSSTGAVGGSAWTQAWWDVFGPGSSPYTLVAGALEEPSAVLPLVRRRRRPWTAELMGVRDLKEPTDVRGQDPDALAALVESVLRARQPLRLKRLPAGSALWAQVRRVPRRRGLVLARPVTGTPTITLTERWQEPEHHFSSRRRADFRTGLRRAEKLGEVEFAVAEPTAAEVPALLRELVAVEGAGWKRAAGTALAVQPRMRAFFERFCVLAAEQGAVRFAAMRIDGRPAAVQLGIEADGRYALFKIGFDEEFARCSPGNLLMLHTVRWAAQRQLHSYEFLGAEEPWTAVWTDEVRECVEVHLYPAGPKSVPAAGAVAGELARRAAVSTADRARSRLRGSG